MHLKIKSYYSEESMMYFSNGGSNCIGYLRGDFGVKGVEFWHTWFEHRNEFNTPEFKAEFDTVVNELRKDLLRDLQSMNSYCRKNWAGKLPNNWKENSYGYHVETEVYKYCIRCTPVQGDYNFYIYCYKK